jgi:hypothetical protein
LDGDGETTTARRFRQMFKRGGQADPFRDGGVSDGTQVAHLDQGAVQQLLDLGSAAGDFWDLCSVVQAQNVELEADCGEDLADLVVQNSNHPAAVPLRRGE